MAHPGGAAAGVAASAPGLGGGDRGRAARRVRPRARELAPGAGAVRRHERRPARRPAAGLLRRRLHRLDRRDGGRWPSPACRRCCSSTRPTPERLRPLRGPPRRRRRRASRGRRARPGWTTTCRRSSRALAGLGAPVTQYKVCSTFDSSPAGRLHRAGDRPRGSRSSAAPGMPMVVAALDMGRYQAFGNLFATVGRRRLPARPPPDDGAPPGDADGRGRPAAPPRHGRPSAGSGSSTSSP